MVGDIVGSPGRSAFLRHVLPRKESGELDFVVANAENATNGNGPSSLHISALLENGADVITLGDHTWDSKDTIPALNGEARLVRPANFAPGAVGRGWTRVETEIGPILVMNLIGRVFMNPSDCPFRKADELLNQLEPTGPVLVDMHAEATSEKIALGRYLDGRVTAVVGTHTHVQTSDDAILPNGTAYLTDLGMTGAKDSVLGREVEPIIQRFLTGQKIRMDVSKKDVALEGLWITLDRETRAVKHLERIRWK